MKLKNRTILITGGSRGIGLAFATQLAKGLAFMPFPSQPIYSATKAALHSYTLSLRIALRKTSVKVFEVCPPVVDTEMTTNVHGYKKMSSAQHARHVISAIEKGRKEIRPGISQLLYYTARIMPGLTLKQLSRAY